MKCEGRPEALQRQDPRDLKGQEDRLAVFHHQGLFQVALQIPRLEEDVQAVWWVWLYLIFLCTPSPLPLPSPPHPPHLPSEGRCVRRGGGRGYTKT